MKREDAITRLKSEVFDVLVIGGGASGSGIALDAQSRGLKVALVEKEDFCSGTSSRSTKLVHGGVRYLEQAVMHLDRSQFRLVRDALKERKALSHIAPHLVTWLPLLIPLYRRFEISYYHAGLRMYDWLAGKNLVHRSRMVSREEALELCPLLNKSGLKGGVIYFDGQFDDARMGISIVLSAVKLGAVVTNYTEVMGFEKSKGIISGVILKNRLTQEVWTTRCKKVVNATGPFTDSIRRLDDERCQPLIRVSSGAHLVARFSQPMPKVGVLIPKTQDKRVLFVLPWLNHLMIGTTDQPASLTTRPKPTSEEVEFIKKEYERYFEGSLTPSEIRSSWSGLRPLVDEHKTDGTSTLSRDHSFEETPSGLLSIFGGKWTTYRLMAQETVDRVLKSLNKSFVPCRTEELKITGAETYSPQLKAVLEEKGLDSDVVHHLLQSYGDQALDVWQGTQQEMRNRVHPKHPILWAEILYCIRREMICRSSDLLFRRTRLGFLDKQASQEVFPKVQDLLANELGWSSQEREADRQDFNDQL